MTPMPLPPHSRQQKIQKKLNIKKYLEELTILVGHSVHENELSSIEKVFELREAAQKFITQIPQTCEISFAELRSEQFREFVKKLQNVNPSPVYIWTSRTIHCGIFLAPSISVIRFDFDFTISDDGVLVFFTVQDMEDRLLLDLSFSSANEQVVEIETRGARWGKITYI